MGKTSRRASPFSVSLPATSANLGPGFDAAALAFDLHLKVNAKPANEFSIVAKGRDSGICGTVENNLILSTYQEVLQAQGKPVVPLALRIENQAPIGKGCGSSASARLAGIALADHFGKLRWSDSKIIGEASRREHHPDNAAACWMGGVAIAKMSGDSEAQVARIVPKGKWPLLFAVPEQPLSTEEARKVLPTQYSRAAGGCVRSRTSGLAGFGVGRPHSPALPFGIMPAVASFAEAGGKAWNFRSCSQRGRSIGPGFA
jgi:homoserine kinase